MKTVLHQLIRFYLIRKKCVASWSDMPAARASILAVARTSSSRGKSSIADLESRFTKATCFAMLRLVTVNSINGLNVFASGVDPVE
nr:hypothetical protein [Paraburkholderia fynbosensis]